MNLGIAADQPLWLLGLLLVPPIVMLAQRRLRAMVRWRRRALVALRASALALMVLALAQPKLTRPDDSLATVFVVDESESTAGALRQAAEEWLARAREAAAPSDRVAVIRFGRWPVVDAGGERHPSVDASATNLQEALRLAADIVGSAGGRRIVLLTDGWENVGNAQETAAHELPPGLRISFAVPAVTPQPVEVAVSSVEAPAFPREGSTFELGATVMSTAETGATLRVLVDDRPAGEFPVTLRPGPNRFTLGQRARSLGLHRYRVEVLPEADSRAENNSGEAVTSVKEAGRVLLLEGHPEEAEPLARMLAEGGMQAEIAAPSTVPSRADELSRFDAVALVNVAATQFTLDQQHTLEQYVQNLGRGLFIAGGNTSYALGGYAGTVLDQVLPVSPAPPTRREQGSVALFLVVDKSGSMDLYRSDTSKMAMAREAAILATEALRAGDTLGVLAFDVRHAWAVPPTRLNGPEDIRAAQARIATIRADGGTSIFPALEEAYRAAAQSDAKLKHIILLTDGQSFDADYQGLIERMRPAQITLSTIAVGSDADTKLLTSLAQIGTGRYYFTERAQDVPKITTKETTIVTRSALVEGRVVPRPIEASPVMLGLAGGQVPDLGGYVATTSRPRASTVLASDRGDPLLAHWQYGLGRVVAWTSDVGGPWSESWQSWPDASRLFQQAIRWAMPEPSQGGFHVSASVAGDQVTFRVESARPDGRFADLLDTRVTVTTPGGQSRELRLPQSEPGVYTLATTAPEPGVYAARFTQAEPGGSPRQETIGFAVPTSPELRTVGVNRSLLNRLAGPTGGGELAAPEEAFSRDFEPASRRAVPLWYWLAIVALVLFTLDVALRRLRFR